MTLPNQLTTARIVMVPIFVVLMSFDYLACLILAYLVFTAATITDYYDGKIARSRNQVSNFGKLLDPVADKVLMAAAFIMLMTYTDDVRISGWIILIIIGREFLVTGARSLAASEGVVVGANKWGKLKTIIQMVYVFTFLFFMIVARIIAHWEPERFPGYQEVLRHTSYWAAVLVALFTAYTGVQFVRLNWQALKQGNEI